MQLHIEETPETEVEETPEVDFFKEHENFENLPTSESQQTPRIEPSTAGNLCPQSDVTPADVTAATNPANLSSSMGPSVKLSENVSVAQPGRKSTIGGRKVQAKRPCVS